VGVDIDWDCRASVSTAVAEIMIYRQMQRFLVSFLIPVATLRHSFLLRFKADTGSSECDVLNDADQTDRYTPGGHQ